MGRQLADLPAEAGQDGAADGPVFVDETGRRSRRYRRVGAIVGLVCAVYAMVIVGTLFSGNSSAPWLPMPGPKDDRPASKVDTPNGTADPAGPSASSGMTPSPGATDDAGATASPDEDGGPGPSRSGDDGEAGTTAGPDPTSGGGGSDPDPDPTDGGGRPDPDPTGDPTAPDPEPTHPTDQPTQQPTQSQDPGGEGGGGGGGEVPVGYTSAPAQSGSGTQQSTVDTKPSSEGAQR